MKEIGLFEAKTHLSKIAEEVKRTGQPVVLTRHGEPYVDLVPHKKADIVRRSQSEVLNDLDMLSRQIAKSSFEQIKADIEQGRH